MPFSLQALQNQARRLAMLLETQLMSVLYVVVSAGTGPAAPLPSFIHSKTSSACSVSPAKQQAWMMAF